MATLPVDEALTRFKGNEVRFEDFINGLVGYITTSGVSVESIRAFLTRIEQVITDSSKIYSTTSAGISATTNGAYFSVPGPDTDTFISLYQNVSGVATLVKTYPSGAYFDFISKLQQTNYAFTVEDQNGRISVGIENNGNVKIQSLNNVTQIVGYPTGYQWAITDESGKIAIGIKDDGSIVIGTLIVSELNTPTTTTQVDRNGGVYPNQLNFINNTGQSLGEGSTPAVAITTSQEYDNVGFPALSTNPITLLPLTVANTQVGSRGESPMYGTLGNIKELIQKENNRSYTTNDYQLAACNNSYGGYSILQLNKGTTPYSVAMTQVQSIKNIATATGKTACFQAVTWTQGEADAVGGTPMSISDYKGYLKQLAIDYNNDGKAITGQSNDIVFISYQMCSRSRNIAIAQLQASNESKLIKVATPTYIFTFADDVHIDSVSAKWLGGYYGLVYKRVVIDRQEWSPLQPIGHSILGSSIDLTFNKKGLVLDTTMVPAQTNNGFGVYDGSGVAQTISSVALVDSNRVRITLASGSFSSGWSIRYGFSNATGMGTFVGGAGNLRDSQGDFLVYNAISKPMHNWCVLFNYPI